MTDGFLIEAKQRFEKVPQRVKYRLRSASEEQVLMWQRRLLTAPDLKTVFRTDREDRDESSDS